MENNTPNLCTPVKSKYKLNYIDLQSNGSDSSGSVIFSSGLPSDDTKYSPTSNESIKFNTNGPCVTSTPFSRLSGQAPRKYGSCKDRRYSVRLENSEKRVDISTDVKSLCDCREKTENIYNEIHMNHLKFKYSRLNSIDIDFNANESYIYLYSALFNSNILSSKFIYSGQLVNVNFVNHRYDSDRYILKIGVSSINNWLSISSQEIIHEIRILKLMGNHPHIEEYCDSWIEDAKMFLQVKLVTGGSLYDHMLENECTMDGNYCAILSYKTASILLAHVGTVLVYMHEVLCLSHGAITSSNILVELMGYKKDIDGQESVRSMCHKALLDDDMNFKLRFKLCDFSKCRITKDSFSINEDHITSSSYDVLSLGLTLGQCFAGEVNTSSEPYLQRNSCARFPGSISDEWHNIIMNLCHVDPRERWTARIMLCHNVINKFILPEARPYLPKDIDLSHGDWFLFGRSQINYIRSFNFDDVTHLSSFTADNYWIQTDDGMVDITTQMQTIEENKRNKDIYLRCIHDKHRRFMNYRLNRYRNEIDSGEKFIHDHPALFNSEVMSFKFSSQILISDTKLSTIYLVDHRFDGDRYILKVGLQPLTVVVSDSSREIINEMRILKLIGNHPNVVGYCDCWIEQEKFHLQLQFVTGGSLYDFLQGQCSQFCVLSDTMKRTQKYYISSQSAYVMLAHIGSVLVYLHDELRVFHGDIKPSNILVELNGYKRDIASQDSLKLYCHKALASEEVNMDLRFKLSDFGRSGPTANVSSMEEGDGRYLPNLSERSADTDYHAYATSRDIFSLGLTIYDCFGGSIDQDSARDIRGGTWRDWPDRVSGNWRHIIRSLSHSDPSERWAARYVIGLSDVRSFVLPEALYHVESSDRYVSSMRDGVTFSDSMVNSMELEPTSVGSNTQSTQYDMDLSF